MPSKHPRTRVEPGLYQQGTVYWACATPPYSRTVKWKKLGTVGIQHARRERDKFAYLVKNGNLQTSSRPLSIRELSAEWFLELDRLVGAGELRPRTVTSYKGGIELHVLPGWGSRAVRSIDADDLVAWHKRQRASGAADWTIRARWMALRGLLAYAARVGYINRSPCDVLTRRERPKPGRPRARYLSESEIQRLLSKSGSNGRTINGTLIFSGVRASELLGLTWGDIDFKQQIIRIRYQMGRDGNRSPLKTESAKRDVILMHELAMLLREHKLAARFSGGDDLVVANGVGRTLGYSRLRKAFAESARRADVDGASPHTCRHTFASILIDHGASVEFVSDQLGHASTKTTWDIYVHLFRARDQAETARRELDAAYGHMLKSTGEDSGND